MKDKLDVRPWFREDIKQLLIGLNFVNSHHDMPDQYRSGFFDALIVMCLLCGIEPKEIGLDEQ